MDADGVEERLLVARTSSDINLMVRSLDGKSVHTPDCKTKDWQVDKLVVR
jgi:hypothetical protein